MFRPEKIVGVRVLLNTTAETPCKGLSVFWIGFELGSNAFAYILSSIFASRKLHLIGRELAMTLGMFFMLI